MSTAASTHGRLTAVRREKATVTPLELFFDLVFVLALTQLTSVIDPEEGAVRLVIFAAMAGLLVAALCVPEAFEDTALLFACAYAVVRAAHIALFVLASRDDPDLRHSVTGLAVGAAVMTSLLVGASFADGVLQGALWALACLWWLYFDIVALVAERRLSNAAPGREQNEIGRDSFSYRLWWAAVLVALIPLGVELPALAIVAIVAALLTALIVVETVRFAQLRDRLRHQVAHH